MIQQFQTVLFAAAFAFTPHEFSLASAMNPEKSTKRRK